MVVENGSVKLTFRSWNEISSSSSEKFVVDYPVFMIG